MLSGGLAFERMSGCAAHATGIFQGPTTEGGFEPLSFEGVDGLQFPEFLQMARRGSGFAVQSSGQEGFLDQIQATVSSGFSIRFQIGPQQVVIDEGARPLIGQVGPDDGLEEGRIFPLQEEIHLMAGELRVAGASLVGCQRRPTHEPIKARQLGIRMEGPQQAEHGLQGVVGFPLAVPGLRQRPGLSADQPLGIPDFRRAAGCFQYAAEALVLKGEGFFGPDNRQPRGIGGVLHIHLDEGSVPEGGRRQPDLAGGIRDEVEQGRRSRGQKVPVRIQSRSGRGELTSRQHVGHLCHSGQAARGGERCGPVGDGQCFRIGGALVPGVEQQAGPGQPIARVLRGIAAV